VRYGQYGAFVDGNITPYKDVVMCFTPIESKAGNVIIAQGVIPIICKQMEENIQFLIDGNIKKILLLTSQVNKNNEIANDKYHTLQMDVNSLNMLNFDVIQFFNIKNLSTDMKFNSLTEYIEVSDFLQHKQKANSQTKYSIKEKYSNRRC